MAKLSVNIGAYSDKGTKDENEDFFGSHVPKEPHLTLKGISIAIADGMSGSEAGKQASRCCIVSFLSDYYSTPDSWSVVKSGQKILSATNSWLYSQGRSKFSSAKGMVSTLSVLTIKSNTAHFFHIGDSRIYLFRNNVLEQLTLDHRIWISDEKNYLNRAMGIEPHLEVDYKSLSIEVGDIFLLTTDGVHDFVTDSLFSQFLASGEDEDKIAQLIGQKAAENHSDDNITCQVVRITSLPELTEDEILRQHVELPFPPMLSPGMILDNYRIEEELHASKRTQIYQAFDTLTQTPVILKTPSVLYDDDTHYIEHFLHEEWAGKRINHENVLKIHSSDRTKSCLYYVTEYIDGITLREWMDQHKKPEINAVRKIIEQIIRGLRAFHRMEMLHQDLKPENIIIDPNGVVKIIDFGSVKIAGIAEITPLENGAQENILGTLNYTAPEYHLGKPGNVKSDQFSLAVICYEMLNNALPFGDNMPEKPTRMNLSKLTYQPSFQHNAMVPSWIDGALNKATSINPNIRYEALSEFMHDLSTPNPIFLKNEEKIPLIERNPLVFWKSISFLLFLSNLALLLILN